MLDARHRMEPTSLQRVAKHSARKYHFGRYGRPPSPVETQMTRDGFLFTIGVLLALVAVAVAIIYRPVRPDSPRGIPGAELTNIRE
jgi:hypothetical protein